MNLRLKKSFIVLLLIVFFTSSFLIVFFAVSSTGYGYSKPSLGNPPRSVDYIGISVGPEPNATNVSLDTAFVFNTMRRVSVSDLNLTPNVPIARRIDSYDATGIGGRYIFYPAEPLQPALTYNISVTIMNEPLSWGFTTMSETVPLQSRISFYIAVYVFWFALAIAAAGTSVIGAVIWIIRRHI